MEDLYKDYDFLNKYIEYASEMTDAPKIFHQRIALSVLSMAVNSRCYLEQGFRHFRCNLWIMLIADSSFAHKSYSISIAEHILRSFNRDYVLPKDFSPEGFMEAFAKNGYGTLIFHELGKLLGASQRSYMHGILDSFMEMYDGYPQDKKLSSKNNKGAESSFNIEKPFLNMISAITPSGFEKWFSDDYISNGFFPRFIFAPYFKRKDRIIPLQPPENKELKEWLIDYMTSLNGIEGEFKLSDKTRELYSKSMMEYETICYDHPAKLHPFFSRLKDMSLKIAMILTLAKPETRNSFTIETQAMEDALRIMDTLTKELIEFWARTHLDDKNNQVLGRIEKALRAANSHGMSRSELYRAVRPPTKRALDDAIDVLIESELLAINESEVKIGSGAKRPIRTYKLIDN